MEEVIKHPVRKGLHKYFHVSKLDTYFYVVLSLSFFALVGFKLSNRILDWGISTSYITWQDTMQIAILWAVLAFVSDSYYQKHEKKYKKFM